MPFAPDADFLAILTREQPVLAHFSRTPTDIDADIALFPAAELAAAYGLVALVVSDDEARLYEPTSEGWSRKEIIADCDELHAQYNDPVRATRTILLDSDHRMILARPQPLCPHKIADTLHERRQAVEAYSAIA